MKQSTYRTVCASYVHIYTTVHSALFSFLAFTADPAIYIIIALSLGFKSIELPQWYVLRILMLFPPFPLLSLVEDRLWAAWLSCRTPTAATQLDEWLSIHWSLIPYTYLRTVRYYVICCLYCIVRTCASSDCRPAELDLPPGLWFARCPLLMFERWRPAAQLPSFPPSWILLIIIPNVFATGQ